MANTIRVSYGSVQSILKDDFEMRCVCAKVIPHIFPEDQMENKKVIVTELFYRSTN